MGKGGEHSEEGECNRHSSLNGRLQSSMSPKIKSLVFDDLPVVGLDFFHVRRYCLTPSTRFLNTHARHVEMSMMDGFVYQCNHTLHRPRRVSSESITSTTAE